MEKVIKIGKQEVRLNNNVAWTMEYKDQFGKDIVPALMPVIASMVEGVSTIITETGKTEIVISDIADALQGRTMEILLPMFQVEFVDTIVNVTWAMAKAADETIAPPKQWVRQFEEFPLDIVGPAIYDMVLKGFVSSKNLKRLKKLGADLKTLQPSHSTPSSSPVSNED
jgi:hypothetical protein